MKTHYHSLEFYINQLRATDRKNKQTKKKTSPIKSSGPRWSVNFTHMTKKQKKKQKKKTKKQQPKNQKTKKKKTQAQPSPFSHKKLV